MCRQTRVVQTLWGEMVLTTISWFIAFVVTFAAMMLERWFGKFTWLFFALTATYLWDLANGG